MFIFCIKDLKEKNYYKEELENNNNMHLYKIYEKYFFNNSNHSNHSIDINSTEKEDINKENYENISEEI